MLGSGLARRALPTYLVSAGRCARALPPCSDPGGMLTVTLTLWRAATCIAHTAIERQVRWGWSDGSGLGAPRPASAVRPSPPPGNGAAAALGMKGPVSPQVRRPPDLPLQPLAHSGSPRHQQPALSRPREDRAPESLRAEPFLQEKPPAHPLGPPQPATADQAPPAADPHFRTHGGNSVSRWVQHNQETHSEDPSVPGLSQRRDQGTCLHSPHPSRVPGQGRKCRSLSSRQVITPPGEALCALGPAGPPTAGGPGHAGLRSLCFTCKQAQATAGRIASRNK